METGGYTTFLIVGFDDELNFTGPYGDSLDVKRVFRTGSGCCYRNWKLLHYHHVRSMLEIY